MYTKAINQLSLKRGFEFLIQISVLAFLVLSVAVGANLKAATSDCYDLEGATTPRPLSSPTSNEGQMDFDLASTPSNPAHKACLQANSDYSDKQILLKGWVWNLNLGWVSLNSAAEVGGDVAPYENLGINTGNFKYESFLDISDISDADIQAGNLETADLIGYWWGDNLGWLSLSCEDGGCPPDYDTSNYRTRILTIDKKGTENAMGNLGGFAWSSAHGWVDMTGVRIPLGHLYTEYVPKVSFMPAETDFTFGIGTHYVDIAAGDDFDVDGDPIVRANGERGYKMIVAFEDEAGNSIAAGDMPAGLDFCFVWDDKRYLDFNNSLEVPEVQTTCLGDLPAATVYGAPDKGIEFSDFSIEGDVFVLKPDKMLTSYVPAGVGEFALDKILINGHEIDLVNKDMIFKAPYELRLFQEILDEDVDCLTYETSENYLDTTLGVNEAFSACGEYLLGDETGRLSDNLDVALVSEAVERSGEEDVFSYLFNQSAQRNYFVCPREITVGEETTVIPANWLTNTSRAQSISKDSPLEILAYVLHLGFRDAGVSPATTLEEASPDCQVAEMANLEVLDTDSIIEDASVSLIAGYTVSSTGDRVVRKGATLEKPDFSVSAAQLSGNIQGDAIQIFKDDSSLSSGGDSTRSAQRKILIQNITNIAKGRGFGCRFNRTVDYLTALGDDDLEACEIDGTDTYVIEFTKEAIQALVDGGDNELTNLPVVAYSDLPDSFKEANKTLVVVGTSLYIDENAYVGDPNIAKGLVVLKNTANTGGHIYIGPEVTDVRAHIYTDGTIYSIDKYSAIDRADKITGLPDADYSLDKSKLRSQLYISGQITSQNTYGGALSATPRLGDGTIVDPTEINKAKWQDLNFWRYSAANLKVQEDAAGDEFVHLCGQPEAWWTDSSDGYYNVGGKVLTSSFFDGDRGTIEEFASGIISKDVFDAYFLGRGRLTDDLRSEFYCWDEAEGTDNPHPLASMYTGTVYEALPVIIKYALPPVDLPLFN